ncbi:MAG: OmpA family protein [Nannocystis sp.]|nr:OmpA family protein [Nannocystis sp.]
MASFVGGGRWRGGRRTARRILIVGVVSWTTTASASVLAAPVSRDVDAPIAIEGPDADDGPGEGRGEPAAAERLEAEDKGAAPRSSSEAAMAAAKVQPSPWIRRYRPSRGIVELGVAAGVLLPALSHELYDYTLPWDARGAAAANFVLRAGYYPLSFLGVEAEGAAALSRCVCGGFAPIFGGRGQVIGQLPLYSVAPFVALGGGLLATTGSLGGDVDPAMHFGGGVKVFINRWFGVRIDARAHVGPAYTREAVDRALHPELLVNFMVSLARPLIDSDKDGSPDPGQGAESADECPLERGLRRHMGCPDRDGDEVRDLEDQCADQAGLAAREGCPALVDSDGDGLFDPNQYKIPAAQEDACPIEAGVKEYAGCPAPDSDGDGLNDLVDRCPNAAETFNGFEDSDGCPDKIPLDVRRILGTIRGIYFGFLSDQLTADSAPILARAAAVLAEHPELKLEIQGHTDTDGEAAVNVDLSLRRAESVRQALINAGIAEDRLRAVGYGGEQPIAANETEEGRAANRRIEFRLLDGEGQPLEVDGAP